MGCLQIDPSEGLHSELMRPLLPSWILLNLACRFFWIEKLNWKLEIGNFTICWVDTIGCLQIEQSNGVHSEALHCVSTIIAIFHFSLFVQNCNWNWLLHLNHWNITICWVDFQCQKCSASPRTFDTGSVNCKKNLMIYRICWVYNRLSPNWAE